MGFPKTRHTLILRLASGGSERDWQDFLADYWGPVCRFALRSREINLDEAEDVAGKTFEVLLRNDLLGRWASDRRAKLRTLLCSVICKVQANQSRVGYRWHAFLKQLQQEAEDDLARIASSDQNNAFFAAWVEDLLQHCLHDLAIEYHRAGKGDYFRVLYGRLCEQLSIAEVAEALQISRSAVDNYYRHVRKRLSEKLETAVRSHVDRYCSVETANEEFIEEWEQLGSFLKENGGIEDAVRRTYALVEAGEINARKNTRILNTLTRIGIPESF